MSKSKTVPLVDIIGTLHNSIDLCKKMYGECNYMEMSRPLYELYKNLMIPFIYGEAHVGEVQDIRERVEVVITDHKGYHWMALKEKNGHGIGMTLK
ncbi:hypothetical protein 035JT004_32 [Bacillus phage 035JT004]|nr:hypothetical protein 035JT004_32 [Bacillus phage 035JT004]